MALQDLILSQHRIRYSNRGEHEVAITLTAQMDGVSGVYYVHPETAEIDTEQDQTLNNDWTFTMFVDTVSEELVDPDPPVVLRPKSGDTFVRNSDQRAGRISTVEPLEHGEFRVKAVLR